MADRMFDVVETKNSSQGGHVVGEVMASGAAVQQVRGQFATAVVVQKPRSLGEVRRRLLEEARLGGEDWFYGWGVGKDAIEGPSINLAMAAARCWGNCAVEPLPVQETASAWIFTCAFIDLETGFTLSRQFRQSKSYVIHGRMDEFRKEDNRFQIGQSKAARNVVLKALPQSLIDLAMAEAKAGVHKKVEEYVKANGIVKAADMLVKALAKHGVKETAILEKCGVAELKALNVDHLVTLKGSLTAIQAGNERAEDLFPMPKSRRTDEVEKALATEKVQEQTIAPTELQTESKNETQPPTDHPETVVAGERKATKAQISRLLELRSKNAALYARRMGDVSPEKLTEHEADDVIHDLMESEVHK